MKRDDSLEASGPGASPGESVARADWRNPDSDRVPASGQSWTTLEGLRGAHSNKFRSLAGRGQIDTNGKQMVAVSVARYIARISEASVSRFVSGALVRRDIFEFPIPSTERMAEFATPPL